MMKYYNMLACHAVIGELAGSRFPYSLDVFNEGYTAVVLLGLSDVVSSMRISIKSLHRTFSITK